MENSDGNGRAEKSRVCIIALCIIICKSLTIETTGMVTFVAMLNSNMNKSRSLFFALLIGCCVHATAQVRTDSAKLDKVSVGIGAGYDFGGYGGNLIVYPQRNIGLFGGVGYTP